MSFGYNDYTDFASATGIRTGRFRSRRGLLFHLGLPWTGSGFGGLAFEVGRVDLDSATDHCSFGSHLTDRFGFDNHRNDRLGFDNHRKLGYDHRDNVRYRGCCSGQLAVRLSGLVYTTMWR